MGKIKNIIMVCAMILLLGSCTNAEEPKEKVRSEYQEIELTAGTRAAADAGNEFAFKLFGGITDEAGNENALCSPFSVFTVMSMLANGDSGEAGDEILAMLCYPVGRSGLQSLNEYCKKMLDILPRVDNSTELLIANSLFSVPYLTPVPEYVELMGSVFNTDYIGVKDEKTMRETVNKWVDRKTSGMIPSILPDGIEAEMAVVNAMYFKSEWTSPFDESNTKTGEFCNSAGTKSEARFMSNYEITTYYENSDIQGMSLSFGNRNFEMQLFRTKSGERPCIDYQTWLELDASGVGSNVSVSLPKFTVEFNKDILEILKSMGLDKAAASMYGLNDICMEYPMCLEFVRHGVKFAIDEAGAEGSAATVAGLMSSGSPERSDSIAFDVPFIYIIREKSTNTILFMGSVNSL